MDYIKIYISPSSKKGSIAWRTRFLENCGPLSGYKNEINSGKSVDSVLYEILNLDIRDSSTSSISKANWFGIKFIYLEYIKSLIEDLSSEDYKQQLESLEAESPSESASKVIVDYGILPGVTFLIPSDKISNEYKDLMGNDVFRGYNTKSLYQDYLKKVESVLLNKDFSPNTYNFKSISKKLEVEVLIFPKTTEYITDITPLINSVETNVNIGSGGNFNISLCPPNSDYFTMFSKGGYGTSRNYTGSTLEEGEGSDLNRETLGGGKDSLDGFNNYTYHESIRGDGLNDSLIYWIHENDLVFIRFENLNCEKKYENKEIKGKYWDMIGLVDTVSISRRFNSININISGRDLIKLLIEDFDFFIPLQFSGNPNTIFGGSDHTMKRLYSGEYNLEFTKGFKSIENSIGFILSQLTHIRVTSPLIGKTFFLKEYGEEELSKQFRYDESGRKDRKEVIDGIWSLVNYYVDEKIAHYRLADASLKSPDGSVMQNILKICQEPFVEVIADTFVDKYNLIIRKPPFAIEDIEKEKKIIIEASNVISDNLQNCRDIYSVFQLIPQGGCFANQSSIALSYLPMVVLDEYMENWGMKLYSKVYNYIDIDSYSEESSNGEISSVKEQFIKELIWLIKINSYLPFSRVGTICLRGDRRIKIGTWIYYEPTGEIFYVNSVQNTASIRGSEVTRETILKVSRGIKYEYSHRGFLPFNTIDWVNTTYDYDKPIKRVNRENTFLFYDWEYDKLIEYPLLEDGLKKLFLEFNKDFNNYENKRAIHHDVGNYFSYIEDKSIVNKSVFNFFLTRIGDYGFQARKYDRKFGIMVPFGSEKYDDLIIHHPDLDEIQKEYDNELIK